jgi:hypothetical protein
MRSDDDNIEYDIAFDDIARLKTQSQIIKPNEVSKKLVQYLKKVYNNNQIIICLNATSAKLKCLSNGSVRASNGFQQPGNFGGKFIFLNKYYLTLTIGKLSESFEKNSYFSLINVGYSQKILLNFSNILLESRH